MQPGLHYTNRMDIEITPAPYTELQWYRMCDMHIGRPTTLAGLADTPMWVYYRPWGLMHVPFGQHQHAMATLYAFHHGYSDYITAARALDVPGYRGSETLADRFLLELEGTAFRSSAGSVITAGRPAHLDAAERQAFRRAGLEVHYLED